MNFIAVFLINLYKWFLSPFIGKNCRFYPTCSSYCKECFETFSFAKALWYSIRRLSKCHPFNPGGIDEIPRS